MGKPVLLLISIFQYWHENRRDVVSKPGFYNVNPFIYICVVTIGHTFYST